MRILIFIIILFIVIYSFIEDRVKQEETVLIKFISVLFLMNFNNFELMFCCFCVYKYFL